MPGGNGREHVSTGTREAEAGKVPDGSASVSHHG